MEIRSAGASDREAWDRFVENSPAASAYHQFGWKRVIERSFGHPTYYLLAGEDALIHGVLPFVRLKSLLFGDFMVSLPFLNYGGICADRADVRARLLQEAIGIARFEGSSHLELREAAFQDLGLPVKTAKVSMRLELPARAEQLWQSFGAKLRSQVRRPEKEGMTARVGREGELDSFFQVFSATMRDLGTPVYAKQFFANILEEFPGSTWIHTVYAKSGEPVASGFLVGFKGVLEIPWAASLRTHNRYSPNMLLYWRVLSFACEHGYRVFDFGRSTPDEGTYRFKEQWGARPTQLHWHYWLRSGEKMPELNPKNPKYRTAIRLWRTLPLGITKVLGPAIVKNLP